LGQSELILRMGMYLSVTCVMEIPSVCDGVQQEQFNF